ncbi:superoxide dismutase [Acidovorax sp. Root275]|uniref:superoxide dismutase family protein n=1 Tax=unclassified Acidovorax TaxID=2684926 RepID=UPI00070AF0CC|nr:MULTISPECIES: superoxide dismutase family protein [unclassified Acidovorax]KRD18324.1 superoxide dismutase [Acidovorax sp. Root267]KRD55717.1 superoxide dismutase [Acidovorax sp. Root275]MBD9391436.1 superoxide dismutase family protein [Acidovorax sp. ACV01]
MKNVRLAGVLSMVAVATLAGCAAYSTGPTATAKLEPTRGNTAAGAVTFVQSGDVVKVSGSITGLKPNAEHGFHVHEKGDCSSGDGMSTGGHFNPGGKSHGHHGMGDHHTGDLPSLKADANGVATFNFESSTIRVGSTANDIVGKGLIVHRDPDDYKTQPTGNAGPRLACAVIAAK